MGMNIKSDDTHRRAKELARITGESIAEAVDVPSPSVWNACGGNGIGKRSRRSCSSWANGAAGCL
jgi:hypothetical protein